MRISDWSSDVCSSDLISRCAGIVDLRLGEGEGDEGSDGGDLQGWRAEARPPGGEGCQPIMQRAGGNSGRKADRKSVVSGKSVSVRVDPGGCRILKTKRMRDEVPGYKYIIENKT